LTYKVMLLASDAKIIKRSNHYLSVCIVLSRGFLENGYLEGLVAEGQGTLNEGFMGIKL